MPIAERRVLVTGADGFIGSHLAEMLVQNGARVTVLSQYNSFNFWGWLEDSPYVDRMTVVSGDVRDAHLCLELTRDIEIVFHLAALIPIPYSYLAPDSYVDTNVKGTLYMLQAARRNGVARFIQTSTSEVYGSAVYVPIDEKHPLQAQSPYSATKIASDAIATSFYNAFECPVIIARPFNTYGPRQSARAVIPTIVSQIADGAATLELGDLSTSRDLTFVEDTCRGFLKLAEMEGGIGEVFNIGSNQEITIGELVKAISKVLGREVSVTTKKERLRPPKSEVLRLRCDSRKIQAATGFAPEVSLEQGLRRTCEWFADSKNLSRYKQIYNV